jgi:transglutaminase-like putative cysteine protease
VRSVGAKSVVKLRWGYCTALARSCPCSSESVDRVVLRFCLPGAAAARLLWWQPRGGHRARENRTPVHTSTCALGHPGRTRNWHGLISDTRLAPVERQDLQGRHAGFIGDQWSYARAHGTAQSVDECFPDGGARSARVELPWSAKLLWPDGRQPPVRRRRSPPRIIGCGIGIWRQSNGARAHGRPGS